MKVRVYTRTEAGVKEPDQMIAVEIRPALINSIFGWRQNQCKWAIRKKC
jgi:hypothetical protein